MQADDKTQAPREAPLLLARSAAAFPYMPVP